MNKQIYYRGTNYFTWDEKCPICESTIEAEALNEYSKHYSCLGKNFGYMKNFGVSSINFSNYNISSTFSHFNMKLSNYDNKILNLSFNFSEGKYNSEYYIPYKVRYIDNSYERLFQIDKKQEKFMELDIKRFSNILNFNEFIKYLDKVKNFA